MIQLFLFIVVIVAVGAGYLAYKNRQPTSIESGISSFRREMKALAPEHERRAEPAPGLGDIRPSEPTDDD